MMEYVADIEYKDGSKLEGVRYKSFEEAVPALGKVRIRPSREGKR